MTASQVIDFASREPVRRRFRLDDDDLARIEEWVAATGIRWGLDAAHRAPYQLDPLESNTWRAGLDRLLLGVTMAEDELRLVGGVLPLDDVDSGDIELAGRFAELIDRLHAAVDRPVAAASRSRRGPTRLPSAADALTATSDSGRLAATRARTAPATTSSPRPVEQAADSSMPLALAEIRAVLADRLRGRPTRANFRTGHLTMCTLVPMRSVPHRVVCLLGLDDGMFPRRTAPDGDDIIERAPVRRRPRSPQRGPAAAARRPAGRDRPPRRSPTAGATSAPTPCARPPCRSASCSTSIDRTARIGADPAPTGRPRRARDQVVVHHPLQPFDARNFVTGGLRPRRPWSFDTVTLGGARASVARSLDGCVVPRRLPLPLDGPTWSSSTTSWRSCSIR